MVDHHQDFVEAREIDRRNHVGFEEEAM